MKNFNEFLKIKRQHWIASKTSWWAPIRNEVIKPDRTGKYVLKLPHASRNKDRKLDQKKTKTNTNQNLDQNLGNKDLPNTTQTKKRNPGATKPNKNDLNPPKQQQNNTQLGETIIQWNINGLRANFEELNKTLFKWSRKIISMAICLSDVSRQKSKTFFALFNWKFHFTQSIKNLGDLPNK
jgi:hypothetical protein